MVVRWIAALVAFLIVALIGVSGFGNFETGIDPGSFFDAEGANSFALILAIALVVGLHRLRRDRIPADRRLRLDRPPVRHPHPRAHADRHRDQHHPGRDRRERPEAADLPRQHRDHPGRRARRSDPGSPDRPPGEPALDLCHPAAVPERSGGGIRHRGGHHRRCIAGMVARMGWLRPRPNRPIGELAIGAIDHDRRGRSACHTSPTSDGHRPPSAAKSTSTSRARTRSSPSSAGWSCCWWLARWSACCPCCSSGATWRPPTSWLPGW